jgi:hypothetical protein
LKKTSRKNDPFDDHFALIVLIFLHIDNFYGLAVLRAPPAVRVACHLLPEQRLQVHQPDGLLEMPEHVQAECLRQVIGRVEHLRITATHQHDAPCVPVLPEHTQQLNPIGPGHYEIQQNERDVWPEGRLEVGRVRKPMCNDTLPSPPRLR